MDLDTVSPNRAVKAFRQSRAAGLGFAGGPLGDIFGTGTPVIDAESARGTWGPQGDWEDSGQPGLQEPPTVTFT